MQFDLRREVLLPASEPVDKESGRPLSSRAFIDPDGRIDFRDSGRHARRALRPPAQTRAGRQMTVDEIDQLEALYQKKTSDGDDDGGDK